MGEPTTGEMAGWTFYQRFIADHVHDTDPRHVEAWMRLANPALDGLSRPEFLAADYFGQTVNLAARIAEYARPNEVLVGQAVVDAAGDGHASFFDIGRVELKGIAGTIQLHSARPRL